MTTIGKIKEAGRPMAENECDKNPDLSSSDEIREDADNRGLFQPATRYDVAFRTSQLLECSYITFLMICSLAALALVGVGLADRMLLSWQIDADTVVAARRYQFISAGGLLGGTVYGSKWLYHAIAKGLWHEDRQAWRYMSPWIAVGATVGICTLLDAGFFRRSSGDVLGVSAAGFTGLGFLVGYLSDSFLAKMKEVTRVVFGESESHPNRPRDTGEARK